MMCAVDDVSMADVGAPGDEMAGNCLPVMATLFQRASREGMPQVVDARSWSTRLASETNRSGEASEDRSHGVVGWCLARCRDEQRAIKRPRTADELTDTRPALGESSRGEAAKRLFWNLVCRMIRPSTVTSSSRSASASEILVPVAATRPNRVEYVSGLIELAGRSWAAARINRAISSG
jgi:hypothetical protein